MNPAPLPGTLPTRTEGSIPPAVFTAPASVAVIVTTHSDGHRLTEAIDCVLEQSTPVAEVVVVDDGSQAHQESVLAVYPNVRWLRHKGIGPAAARNAGLAAAHSDRIMFIEAGDRLLPHAVAVSLACFDSHPGVALVHGGCRWVGEDGAGPQTAQTELPDALAPHQVGPLATAMYDRRRVAEHGGFPDPATGQDPEDLNLRLMRQHGAVGHPIVVVDCRAPATAQPSPAEDAAHSPRPKTGLGTHTRLAVKRVRDRLQGREPAPAFGRVDFGDFDAVRPISGDFGYDRGTPLDRHYIERFLDRNANLIQGRVLEIGDATYSRRFGGARIARQDVLHVSADNSAATIVGSLDDSALLPQGVFDCLVITQTLHLIWDMQEAVRTMHRALKPGGVALVTVPGLSPIDRGEWRHTWYWFLTQYSVTRLFAEVFGPEQIEVRVHGNAHAATAFIQGVALEELRPEALEPVDESLAILVTVVARKAG